MSSWEEDLLKPDILDTALMAWPHFFHRLWARYFLKSILNDEEYYAEQCDLSPEVVCPEDTPPGPGPRLLVTEPGMSQGLGGCHPLSRGPDQQTRDEAQALLWDVIKLRHVELIATTGDKNLYSCLVFRVFSSLLAITLKCCWMSPRQCRRGRARSRREECSRWLPPGVVCYVTCHISHASSHSPPTCRRPRWCRRS